MYALMYIYTMNEKAKFFKALGDVSRLRIVSYLLKEDYCACDFTSGINKDQTTISRHLKILVEAGILKNEKKGRNIIYSIKDGETKSFLKNLGIPSVEYCCNARRDGDNEKFR
jgi:ArsR family transcriptional regulator, lead/cadmium/zinc/bismuth-responsive transcriptional repressor